MIFYKKSLFVIIGLAFFVLGCSFSSNELNTKSTKGILDLSESISSNNFIIKLNGEWDVNWGSFQKTFKPGAQNRIYYNIPSSWNRLLFNKKNIGGQGAATMHLKILLPKGEKKLGLQIREFSSAYDLYINGKKEFSRGIPSTHPTQSIPEIRPALHFFETNKTQIDIIIHISNYSHRKGGAWHHIYFGDAKSLQTKIQKIRFLDVFLIGIFFIIALYHFGLFAIRRNDLPSLVFSFFCFSTLIRHGLTGERLLLEVFPFISYANMLRIEYATIFIGAPVALNFFSVVFPKIIHKNTLYIFYILGFLFTGFSIFTPPVVFTESIPIYQPILYCCILCGIYIVIIAIRQKRPFVLLMSIGLFIFSLAFVNDILFQKEILKFGFLIQYGFLVFILTQALIISLLFAEAYKKVEVLSKNLKSLNIAYARFVPIDFLTQLRKEDIRDIHLGDQIERDMTILFSDIRSFTHLSEKMTTKENFSFINTYLGYMTPLVSQNKGFIDKYIGDAIMALFPERSEDALNAAIAMQSEVQKFNHERISQEQEAIQIGIGLHAGNLMLGTIGSSERMDGTVISDTVNTSSRIEELTKTYGSYILISENVLQRIQKPELYSYRFLDCVLVKGKDKSINIYEVFDGQEAYKIELFNLTKESFEKGVQAYFEKQYNECLQEMKAVLKINPADKGAMIYVERCSDHL